MGLTTYVFSNHARQEIERRNIPEVAVEAILSQPEQVLPGKDNRTIYQSRLDNEVGKTYLIRVFVEGNLNPPVVVTVYRTSKIQKYWRAE